MLLHQFLRMRTQAQGDQMEQLLVEQRRTNRLLQSLLYGAVGFLLGLLVMQVIVRVKLF